MAMELMFSRIVLSNGNAFDQADARYREVMVKIMGHNDNTVSKYIKVIKPFISHYMAKDRQLRLFNN